MRDPRVVAFADQAVVSGSNFITTVIVARQLSPVDFGLFSLAFMVCLFLSNLHRAGFTQPLNVLGANDDRERLNQRLASLLRLQLLAIPLAACVVAVAAWFAFPSAALAAAAIAYFACFALQETLRRYWYTGTEIREALTSDLISYGGQVVVLLVLAYFGWLQGVIALLAMGATSLLSFIVGVRRIGQAAYKPFQPFHALAQEHWPMAKWLLLTVLAVWGAGQVYPLLMVPLGAAAVAAFAACRNLLNVMGLIVQSVGNYIPAHAAATLRTQGPAALKRKILGTCSWALAGGALFLLLIHLLAEPLLHLVYGGRYDHAAPLLRILAVGTVCTLLGAILGAYALAMQDARSNFLSNLGASVTTFTVGMWLINVHGLWGAALGAALSLATAMALQAGFVALRVRRLAG